jgi:hypothetical protein
LERAHDHFAQSPDTRIHDPGEDEHGPILGSLVYFQNPEFSGSQVSFSLDRKRIG